jgi:hypothetical protein
MNSESDSDRLQNQWAEINRHLGDAATVFQQLPEGAHMMYLSCAIGAWQRVAKAPLTGEQLADMVEVLFTDDERGESIIDSLNKYRKEEP